MICGVGMESGHEPDHEPGGGGGGEGTRLFDLKIPLPAKVLWFAVCM